MLIFRLRAWHVSLALMAVAVVGCGGGHTKTQTADSSPPASASATATPVSYTPEHVKSSLLTADDVGSGTRTLPVTITGFKKNTVPSCADTAISLPGKPSTTAHQFGPPDPRSSAPNYAEQAAVFPDAASAASAFAHVKSTISACPGKQRVRSKKLGRNQVTLPYSTTWKTTTDSMSGWTHVQGFEKRTYSPSASIINVIYETYDYAYRGNALIASLYLKRVKPAAAGDPVTKQATALLAKQLAKIG